MNHEIPERFMSLTQNITYPFFTIPQLSISKSSEIKVGLRYAYVCWILGPGRTEMGKTSAVRS